METRDIHEMAHKIEQHSRHMQLRTHFRVRLYRALSALDDEALRQWSRITLSTPGATDAVNSLADTILDMRKEKQ